MSPPLRAAISSVQNKKGRQRALPSASGERWKFPPQILLVKNGNALPTVDAQPAVPAFGRTTSFGFFSAVTAGENSAG
jgi:hypothetical protein